jgi:uncharacterized protein (TIGR03545 family)
MNVSNFWGADLRKKGLIFLGVLIVVILILSLIFTDWWVENKLEKYGSAIVGAKVEFDDFHFSITGLNVRWSRLQVTDPQHTMTNLFETEKCDFDLAVAPLFSKKFNVENFEMQGLRFGTPRETDGKLSEEEKKAAGKMPEFVSALQKNLNDEASRMPVFQIGQLGKKLNVDSIYALVNLQSPQKIDSLKTATTQKFDNWQSRFQELPDEQDLADIKNKLNAIDPGKISKLDELQNALKSANEIQKQLNDYKQSYQSIKSDFNGDLKNIKATDNLVQSWIQADYRRALSLAKLPDLSVQNIAKLVFGKRIINKINLVTRYVGTARYYSQKFQPAPKKESPPRLKGMNIYFGKPNELPKFWIKYIGLSGEIMQNLQLSGNVANIVSNQKVIGEPTTFSLGGKKAGASVKVDGVFDYLEDILKENFALNFDGISLNDVKLTDFPLLPSRIENGIGNLQAKMNFDGKNFTSSIIFASSHLRFTEPQPNEKLDPRVVKVRNSIMKSINEIRFTANVEQQEGEFKFKISSNLDNLIADQVKSLVSEEVEAARKKIEQRINQEVSKYKEQLNTLIAQNEQKLTGQLQSVESQLGQYESQIDQVKKEIEKKIKESAGGKIKDLFKK